VPQTSAADRPSSRLSVRSIAIAVPCVKSNVKASRITVSGAPPMAKGPLPGRRSTGNTGRYRRPSPRRGLHGPAKIISRTGCQGKIGMRIEDPEGLSEEHASRMLPCPFRFGTRRGTWDRRRTCGIIRAPKGGSPMNRRQAICGIAAATIAAPLTLKADEVSKLGGVVVGSVRREVHAADRRRHARRGL